MVIENHGVQRSSLHLDNVPIVRDRHAALDHELVVPSRHDRRFTGVGGGFRNRTIFLDPSIPEDQQDDDDNYGVIDGLVYSWSDRYQRWYGPDRMSACFEEAALQVEHRNSAEHFEAYLRLLLNQPEIGLWHMLSTVDGWTFDTLHGYGITLDGHQP